MVPVKSKSGGHAKRFFFFKEKGEIQHTPFHMQRDVLLGKKSMHLYRLSSLFGGDGSWGGTEPSMK